MSKRILHVVFNDKFIVPFIDFMNENNLSENHTFLFFGGASEKVFPIPNVDNIDKLEMDSNKLKKLQYFLKYFYTADKIILHSLFNPLLVKFLYFQPWVLKKCYWVMWGGDLYYHILEKESSDYLLFEKWRRKVIGKMGHFITYIKGDYELAQEWYGAQGQYHECFMYPSNLYKEYNVQKKVDETINIQLGNSADPTNNHLEILNKLVQYKDNNIKIYVPLSYGNQEHAKEVIKKGRELFGDKFQALTEFMPFEKYLVFLGKIDIAIFAHTRQQAMGNTITLLGLGKKVYIRNDTTPWILFKDIDVKVYNVEDISLEQIDKVSTMHNQNKIKNYFSEENYIKQLNNIFKSKL